MIIFVKTLTATGIDKKPEIYFT